MKKSPWLFISLTIIGAMTFLALFAPVIAPYSFDEQNMDKILTGPSIENFFGTDGLGRDLFSRVIYGARVSMAVAFGASILTLVMGCFVGALAGYWGGWVDRLLMRTVDVFDSIPAMVIMILVSITFNSWPFIENDGLRSVIAIIIALSLVGWMGMARLVRGQFLQLRELPFVEAARSQGVPWYQLILRHLLPNAMGPIIVFMTFQIPSFVLQESFLSFIGLGLQPPYSSWGVLANEGWRSFQSFPHLIIYPGLAIFITMMAFNLLGDSMRDQLDPRYKPL